MCGFYYIAFIEYMLAGKALLDYTNCFSPNNYRNNDKLLYKYLWQKKQVSSLETRNYLLVKIKCNDLMSEKYRYLSI